VPELVASGPATAAALLTKERQDHLWPGVASENGLVF
jgi:hypothetical protein